MPSRSLAPVDPLHPYLRRVSPREPALLARGRTACAGMEGAGMQVAPGHGQVGRLPAQGPRVRCAPWHVRVVA